MEYYEKLIANLCSQHDWVAIINVDDLSVNTIYISEKFKPYQVDSFIWNDNLKDKVSTLFNNRMIGSASRFFTLHRLNEAIKKEVASYEILLKNNRWEKFTFQYFDEAHNIIMKVIDCTDEHNYADSTLHLLIDSSNNIYDSVFKVYVAEDKVCKITINDQKVTEVILNETWSNIYSRILNGIDPEEKADVYRKTNIEILKDSPSNTSIFVTYRKKHTNSNDFGYYNCYFYVHESVSGEKTVSVFIIDITNSILEKEYLIKSSERDELTYLYNRSKFERMLETEYTNLNQCGVLFFDVNDLKEVNDKYGHRAGDELICLAAESIRSIANRNVHAYRFGGDEFVVIAKHVTKDECYILKSLWETRLFELNKSTKHPCQMAVGLAWSNSDINIETLLEEADHKMYINKQELKRKQN